MVATTAGAAVLTATPSALAATAPVIVSYAPASVGMGAGQGGHPALAVTLNVDNVATTDTVTVTFPGYTGLTAAVQTPLTTSGGHTVVVANVSTSATSTPSSGFNLTLTDVTTGLSDSTNNPFAINAAPTLSSASPARLLVGTGPTTVTFTGTGFVDNMVASAPAQSQVTFGPVSFTSSTSVKFPVTVGNTAPGGPVAVTLTNPDAGWSSQSGALSVDSFPVSSISPTSAPDTPNTLTPVTVTGTGIPSGNTVLNLTPTFAVTGQNTITTTGSVSPDGKTWQGNVNLSDAAPGNYQVQLANGSNVGTLSSPFTVTSVGTPTVTSVSPSSVGQGADATLTIVGTNFAHGATVTFSKAGFSTTGPVVFTSSTQIQVPIHVAGNAATGSNNATNVTVTNTDSKSGTKTAALQVTPPPTISSLSPSTLGQGAATTLTVNGSGFQSGATVTFGTGVTATTTPTVLSSTQIRLTIKVASDSPAHVVVTVKNPDQGTATATLTVNAVNVTSVSPHYVPTTFSGTLTVTGAGFQTGATVTFPAGSGVAVQGGKSATVAANHASLTVPIVVSRSTAAPVDVTVTNSTTDLGTATCTGCLVVATAPGSPTNVTATKSGTSATIHWDAVITSRDGGAPITNYTVTVTAPAGSGIPAQTITPPTTTATFNNLNATTDYVFAVTATNAANLTSPAASVSTSRKSALTLQAGTARTVSGQVDPLSGRLLDVHGSPITGATVVVQARSDTGRIGVVGSTTTDAAGGWSIVVRPRTNQAFTATYAGDATNDASTSNSVRVVVSARVAIHGVFVSGGHRLKVYGSVAPNKAGDTVRLIGRDNAGHVRHFGSRVLDSRSHYQFTISLPAGRWRLQVLIGATVGNAAGRSATLVAHG